MWVCDVNKIVVLNCIILIYFWWEKAKAWRNKHKEERPNVIKPETGERYA